MGFAEKSAWIMSVALLGAGLFYVWAVWHASAGLGQTAPPNIGLAVVITIPLVAFAIFGHAVAALGNPADANAPEDERDRLIAWRSGNLAGLLFGAVAVTGLAGYALTGDGNLLFRMIVLGLVLSQLSDYVLSIVFYRFGV